MNLFRFPKPTEIEDFTDSQKVLFLQISVNSLIKALKKKELEKNELQYELDDKQYIIQQLERKITKSSRSIQTLHNKIKRLDR